MDDSFLDVIRLLRPHATLWATVEAGGRWALSFRQHGDLLFCWVQAGTCLLLRPKTAPITLRADDLALVRTTTAFRLASDIDAPATDSEKVLASEAKVAKLGDGKDLPTSVRGGRFVFDTANEQLLTGLLPQVVHVEAAAKGSRRVRALLAMNESGSSGPAPGSDFVIARLMELVLVEIMRSRPSELAGVQTGLLTGLADPLTARALTALHGRVAHPWTTAKLARLCGTSRSALGARFSRLVGIGPIKYLQLWRIALAKEALRRGEASIGEIALRIGFQSSSAFSTAFKRAEGCSLRDFMRRASGSPFNTKND